MPATIEIDESTPVVALDKQTTITQAKQAQAAAAVAAVEKPKGAAAQQPVTGGAEATPADEDTPVAAVKSSFLEAYKKGLTTKQDTPVETKPVEKPASEPAADDYKPGTKADDWKKLHARVKESETKHANLLKELEAIKTEYEKAKSAPVIDPKEVESLKTEKQQLLDKLEVIALEQSPRFKEHYDKLFTDATALAKDSVPDEHKDLVEDLLSRSPSKQRKAAIGELLASLDNEADKVNLAMAFRQMDAARAERTEALSKSKEHLTKISEFEKTKAAEDAKAKQARMEATIKDVLNTTNTLLAFQPEKDDPAERDRVEANRKWVLKYFSGELSPTETMVVPALAKEAMHLREKVMPALEKENAELKEAIARLTAATPGGGDEGPSETTPSGQQNSFISSYMKYRKGQK